MYIKVMNESRLHITRILVRQNFKFSLERFACKIESSPLHTEMQFHTTPRRFLD